VGRIYDALRRSTGGRELAPAPPSTPNGDLFSSPWTFSRAVGAPSISRAVEAPSISPEVDVPSVLKALEAPSVAEPVALADLPSDDQPHDFAEKWTSRLAVSIDSDPILAEQFRFLGARLHRDQAGDTLKRIMVTSASPGDGKTLTALNLALILSESYRRRVLLIDADLRRPSIHEITQIAPMDGLSERLRSKEDRKLSVVKLTRNLTLLPAGRPDSDPMSTLTSPRMQRILDEASARFDWVVLDTPPMGPVADAGLLAAMTDAVIFVIRAGYTRAPEVQRAIAALGRDHIYGVVLNGVEPLDVRGYQYYGAPRD
jgi:protein-tyrosine kinase